MKLLPIAALVLLLCASCNTTTPSQYFDRAALNCNMFSRFGSYELKERLTEKGLVYSSDRKSMVPATSYRESILQGLVVPIEENERKVKGLKVTDETRPMISSSLELYKFVLDKYRNDYTAIAALKDANAPQEEITKALEAFDEKNLPVFNEKYQVLLDHAMAYAKKNNIQVSTYQPRPF